MEQTGTRGERWDIYDRDRRRTGRFGYRGEALAPGEHHLVVHICIFNAKNELLMQRRQLTKRKWPGLWDVSAAGAALAGEDSRAAAARETCEELGVSLDLSKERPVFSISFDHGFDDYWIVEREIPVDTLHLQAEEVLDARWVAQEEALRLAAQGEAVPYWFWDHLFDLRRLNGAILPR